MESAFVMAAIQRDLTGAEPVHLQLSKEFSEVATSRKAGDGKEAPE